MGARVLIVKVEFSEGEAEVYSVPLSLVEGERAENLLVDAPERRDADLPPRRQRGDRGGADRSRGLPRPPRRHARPEDARGLVGRTARGQADPALRAALNGQEPPEPSIFRAEQSNTSVIFGQSLIMKFFRKVEAGVNPDLELGLFLGERSPYANTPAVAGSLEYSGDGAHPATLAIVHEFVPNEGDAWQYTLDALGRFYEQALTEGVQQGVPAPDAQAGDLIARALAPIPEAVGALVGSYIQSAELLGTRVGRAARGARRRHDGRRLHAGAVHAPLPALGLPVDAEPDRRGRCSCCAAELPSLDGRARDDAEALLAGEADLLARFARCGRPARRQAHPLSRRPPPRPGALHRPRLRDHRLRGRAGAQPERPPRQAQAPPRRRGLLRSFHYASYASLLDQSARGLIEPESDAAHDLEAWGARGSTRSARPSSAPTSPRPTARSGFPRVARTSRCCSTPHSWRRRSTS